MTNASRRPERHKGPVTLRGDAIPPSTADERLLDSRTRDEWKTKDAWRAPQDITKTYLRFLEENGYPLSDIEQVILGKKADAVYRQVCKED